MNARLNSEEAAICKRRGHEAQSIGILSDGLWSQCKWCGTWVRETKTLHEREDAPAKDEQR